MPVLTTLAALTLATAAQTQTPTPPSPGGPVEVQTRVMVLNGPGGEQGLDADKDGFVTRQEFAAPLDRAFAGSCRRKRWKPVTVRRARAVRA